MTKRKTIITITVMLLAVMMFSISAFAASKAPKKIKLSSTKLTMAVGDKATLKASFTPAKANKKVKWTTSNKAVATVSSKGKVSAKKTGKATITCTSKAKKKVKAKCKVTVLKEGVKPEKIVFYDSSKDMVIENVLLEIGFTYKLNLKFTPANTTYTDVKWVSADPKIATVDANGVCKGIAGGKTTVTCTSVKCPDVKVVCNVEVMKDKNAPDDEELLSKFKTLLAGTGEPLYKNLQGSSPSSKMDSEGKTIWTVSTALNGTINYISIYERGTYNTLGCTYCMYSSPTVTFGGAYGNASTVRSSLMDGTYDFAGNPSDVIIGWSMWNKDTTKDAIQKMINGTISDEIYNKLIEYSQAWSATRAGGSVVIVYGKDSTGKLAGRYAGHISYNMASNAASYTLIGIAADNKDTYGVAKSGSAMY